MSDILKRAKDFIAACGETTLWAGHPAVIMQGLVDRIEALEAEVERLTPLAVAYDYLESPARADQAEASLAASQAEASRLREALAYAAMGLGRIHDSLLSNGPKQASGEMAMHFRDKARAALSSGSKT